MAVDSNEISHQSSLHRTKQTEFSQPLLIHPVLQPPDQLNGLCWASISIEIFTFTGEPQTGHNIQIWYHRWQTEGKGHFPETTGYTLANMVNYLWWKGHCRSMLSLLMIRISRSFSFEPLSSQFAPSLCWCMGLFLPRCRIWHLPMVIFVRFLCAHFSNLAGSLWMAAWTSSKSTTPHRLLEYTTLLKICLDLICLKTFREEIICRGEWGTEVCICQVCRPVVKSGLNSSCPWRVVWQDPSWG